MNAIMNKKNNGKLLATFVAMLMIVCAVAVVATSSDAATAGEDGKPTIDFSGAETIEIGADTVLGEALKDKGYADGVLTVTTSMVLNIAGTVGSSAEPALKQIILNGGDLQITGTGTIYIANDAANGSTVAFIKEDGVLSITDGVTVNLDAKGDSSFVINNGVTGISGATNNVTALVSVTDEATLNVTHTLGKSTWYNADGNIASETYFDVNGATVNFTESHSVQGVVLDADKATITLKNTDATGIVLKNGSTITASNITINGTQNAGLYLKGTVTVEDNSKLSIQNTNKAGTEEKSWPGINIENVDSLTSEIKIDETSSVSAPDVGFANDKSSTLAVSGSGKFSANLNAGNTATTEYTFTGVTIAKDMTVGSGVSVELDSATIDNDVIITVQDKATVSVPEGKTLTNNGRIVTEGDGKFDNKGTVVIANATELGNTIEGSLSVPNASYLVNHIEVKEGGALIIQKGAYLDLMGYTLTLNGNLTIEKNATIVDSTGGGSIKIVGKGAINNEGIIGEGNAVTVSSDYGSVTLKDISGIVFTTEKKVVDDAGKNIVKYVLDVSGTIEAEAKTGSSIGFDTANGIEDGVLINADTEIRKDVAAIGAVTVKGGATLTLNGDSTALTVTMLNNSTVKANAGVGSIAALTGEYQTFSINGDRVTIDESTDGIDTSSVTMDNVNGIIVKVSSKIYDKTGADGKAVSYTEQMMSVSGALSLVNTKGDNNETLDGSVTINGNVYILAGETLSAGKTITVSNSQGDLITEGKAVIVTAGDVPEITYKGTMYVQSTEGSTDKTYTYTNFTDAFANIEAADDKTVTLMGGYEFTGTVTIANGQVVEFTDDAKYTIAADATVIVQNGGELSESFATGDDKGIKGVLTVMDGGDCEPVDGSYEVLSTDAEENITYSSAQTAIKNAVSGTTVDIVDGAILKDAATVVSGVTVNVHDGVNLQAQKGLTVAEGGKVVNEGTITISDKYGLIVAGEVDSVDGTIALGGAESEMTVTGTVSYPTKMTAGVNAAVYVNEDHYVYTTVAKAVTAVSAMDIAVPIDALGTFSESGTVTLTEDMELNIVGKQITLGTVVLETGADLNVNAGSKLTATISGACGTDGTVSVALSKVEGISFTETFNSSTSVAALVMSSVYSGTEPTLVQELAGTVTVSAGTVTVDGTMTFDGVDNILVVSSGAVIAVPENSAIVADTNTDSKVAVTVEGTMDLVEGTFTVNAGAFAAVSGTVNVSESGPNTGLVVTGTLTVTGTVAVSDVEGEEGILKITGVLALGDKPTTIGAAGVVTGPVTLEGSGYIKAYNGADVTGADINVIDGESAAVSTAFNVNGWLYMTVYALEEVKISNDTNTGVLDNEKFDLVGYVTKDTDDMIDINEIEQWYTDAELTDEATADAKVGDPSALYFKANAAEVRVDISVGEGISLYIDGIKQSGSYNILKVGTHTVTATVNPGFKGDVTITFNGQAISGGEFTITPEMASATYDDAIVVSASGNITTDSTVVIDGGSSGDGMGLTDYLLIILVVLIVIMAIMVAMRLMRS